MTVNYNMDMSTSHPWTLLSLLFRWKGSVWKYVYVQYFIWLGLFAVMSFVYRFAFTTDQQQTYNSLANYLDKMLDKLPMDLILGFFTTAILNRFYTIYKIIGFMDNIALLTSMYVRGTTKRAILFRRNIIRFVQINQVLVFRDLSMKARKRFPTLDTVVAAGFMMPHEKERFDEIQYRYSKYWLPIQWALATAYNARSEGYIESDYYTQVLSEEIKKFRTDIAWLCNYDWVPLPLIYPTIVCLLVHSYFTVCIFARQFLTGEKIDLYFPFMTSIQFIFYMGWLKVGEQMLNPWGEDDDDFETNMLVDRNLALGLKMVDDGYGRTPEMRRDSFWDEEWTPLYSAQSAANFNALQEGSISHVKLPSSVSAVRMVPRGSFASLQCPLSPDRSMIVPVKPGETRKKSSFDVLRGTVFSRSQGHSSSNLAEQGYGSGRRPTLSDVVQHLMMGARRDVDIALGNVFREEGETKLSAPPTVKSEPELRLSRPSDLNECSRRISPTPEYTDESDEIYDSDDSEDLEKQLCFHISPNQRK